MEIPLSIIDAFTQDDQPFTGNGAAVCILQFDVRIGRKSLIIKIEFTNRMTFLMILSKKWRQK